MGYTWRSYVFLLLAKSFSLNSISILREKKEKKKTISSKLFGCICLCVAAFLIWWSRRCQRLLNISCIGPKWSSFQQKEGEIWIATFCLCTLLPWSGECTKWASLLNLKQNLNRLGAQNWELTTYIGRKFLFIFSPFIDFLTSWVIVKDKIDTFMWMMKMVIIYAHRLSNNKEETSTYIKHVILTKIPC